jgi:hypothetical protein
MINQNALIQVIDITDEDKPIPIGIFQGLEWAEESVNVFFRRWHRPPHYPHHETLDWTGVTLAFCPIPFGWSVGLIEDFEVLHTRHWDLSGKLDPRTGREMWVETIQEFGNF